jgi:hypothetical protein
MQVQYYFECVEQASTEYSIIWIMHVRHTEGYKFSSYVLRLLKDTGKDMEPTGSILSPRSHKGALLLLSIAFCRTPFGQRLTRIKSWLGYCC